MTDRKSGKPTKSPAEAMPRWDSHDGTVGIAVFHGNPVETFQPVSVVVEDGRLRKPVDKKNGGFQGFYVSSSGVLACRP